MMRLLIATVAFAVSGAAGACSCVRLAPASPSIATESALIFSGKVVEIVERSEHTLIERDGAGEGRVRPLERFVVLRVLRSWRGVKSDTVEVQSEWSDCMYRFRVGGEYLVFADRRQGKPHANACSRTTDLSQAQPLLQILEAAAGAAR